MSPGLVRTEEVSRLLARGWPAIARQQFKDSPAHWPKGDGFSRSEIWQVRCHDQTYCLKGMPTGDVTSERLAWVQLLLRYVKQVSPELPLPVAIASGDGLGFMQEAGQFWELTPWLPGMADLAGRADEAMVTQAFQAAAKMHLALEQWGREDGCFAVKPSEGVLLRHERLVKMRSGGIFDLAAALGTAQKRGMRAEILWGCEQVLSAYWDLHERAFARLEVARHLAVPIFPAVRDLRAEHFLFSKSEAGEKLTGVVDFGAMRLDSVMLDLSRLMTTLVPASEELRAVGLKAYREVRELTNEEADLLPALVEGAALHNGLQWVIWLLQEGKVFEDWGAVSRRLQQVVESLQVQRNTLPGEPKLSPGGIWI